MLPKKKKPVGVENFQPTKTPTASKSKKPVDKIKPLSKKQQIEADEILANQKARKRKPSIIVGAENFQPSAKVTIKKKSVKIVGVENVQSTQKKANNG